VDAIIMGTGFHVTDWPMAGLIRGRDGRTMAEAGSGHLDALHGTTVAGFPNLFILLGANTGVGHTSVVVMAEAQVRYIVKALKRMRSAGADRIEARPEIQEAWNLRLQKRLQGTVWNSGGCSSWYLDSSGRNTTIWPDFSFRFLQVMNRFDPHAYSFGTRPGAQNKRRGWAA
jgi:hypothetical protein